MKKVLKHIMLAAAIMLPAALFPQLITATLQSVPSCPGDTLVPVTVANINNVGAISLVIEFDDDLLDFVEMQDLNEQISPEFLFTNSDESHFYFNWVSNDLPLNIINDTLFSLTFNFSAGHAGITWMEEQCEFADADGNTLQALYFDGNISSTGRIPIINNQPIDVELTETGTASFSLTVTGDELNYQWQESSDLGNSWIDLSNSGLYSDVHTSTLSINNVPLTINNYQYRCVILGICTPEIISNEATLIVNRLPIQTSLQTTTECPGEFSIPVNLIDFKDVAAISLTLIFDDEVLNYQGYSNLNAELSGGLIFINAYENKVFINWASAYAKTIGDGTLVQLDFSSAGGTATLEWDETTPGACEYGDINGGVLLSSFSNSTVTVNTSPTITQNPENISRLESESATFSIAAGGTSPNYHWQLSTDGGNSWNDLSNGSPYSGVTTANLSVNPVSILMDGNLYRCKVNGTCPPEVISEFASLSVQPQSQLISVTIEDVTTCPEEAIVPIFTSNCNGIAAMSLVLNYDQAVLSFDSYQNLNPLFEDGIIFISGSDEQVFINWASTDAIDIGDAGIIELKFTSLGGSASLEWDIQTQGACEFADESGNIILSEYDGGNAQVYYSPYVINQPQDADIPEGGNTSFSISAGGTTISYQWQVSNDQGTNWVNLGNNAQYSGTTGATLNIQYATIEMSGKQYRCIVSGQCDPPAESEGATLTVQATPQIISTAIESVVVCAGEFLSSINVGNFEGVSAFSLVLNFDQSQMEFLSCQNFNPGINTENFISNALDNKIYFAWVAEEPLTIQDGILFKIRFTSSGGAGNFSWDTETSGACEFSNSSGEIIGATFSNGNAVINPPPIILAQPETQTIAEGENAVFSIVASGYNLSYRWQQSADSGVVWTELSNNTIFSGATSTNLTLNSPGTDMSSYWFRCKVMGGCPPDVFSNPAILVVTPLPQIITTSIPNLTSCSGNVLIPVIVGNFYNVAAFTYTLAIDTTIIKFDKCFDLHPDIGSGFLFANSSDGFINFSYAYPDPMNIGNDTLFYIKCYCTAGSSEISWQTTYGNCEYSDFYGNPILAEYSNGSLIVAEDPLLVLAGNDELIIEDNSVTLNATISGGASPYTILWQPVTGLSDPTILDPVASPPSSTTYTLTILDNEICISMDDLFIEVIPTQTYTISGIVSDELGPVEGIQVTFEGLDGVISDQSGFYSKEVPEAWTGIVKPISFAHNFQPEERLYEPVYTNYSNQDYQGTFIVVSADFTADDTQIEIGETVHFTDQSTGGPTFWKWDFNNDGLIDSEDQNPDWTFEESGFYSIKLHTGNGTSYDSITKIDFIYVREPIEADFTATPLSGYFPLIVQFTDLSVGLPVSWVWDFDNNGIIDSDEQNPVWEFNNPGFYTITLKVTNDIDETDIMIREDFIEVLDFLPIISVSPNNIDVSIPKGDSLIIPLTIENTGMADLNWIISDFNQAEIDVLHHNFTYQTTYEDNHYFLSNDVSTWQNAKSSCESTGGHLVTITSETENNIVFGIVPTLTPYSSWIGLSDSIVEGDWFWITGEIYDYTNWDEDQPNNAGIGEDFGCMNSNGFWNDLPSDVTTNNPQYVMEKEYELPDYLSLEANYGSLIPGNSQIVNLKISTSGLSPDVYNTSITVYSNDTTQSGIIIPIQFKVLGGEIMVVPTNPQLPDTYVEDTQTMDITVSNSGNLDITIDSIYIDQPFSTSPFYNLTFSPDEFIYLTLSFFSEIPGFFSDTLFIKSGDELSKTVVSVHCLIKEPPVIITDPLSQNLCEGDLLMLNVEASGSLLQYQWYKDGEVLEGDTLPHLDLALADFEDEGTYYCQVYNSVGSVVSNPAIITVSPDAVLYFETGQELICETETFQPQPIIDFYSSLLWTTNGDGAFSDSTAPYPIYFPGPNDIETGSMGVDICLTTTPIAPCMNDVTRCIQLLIQKEPVSLAGDDATICEDDSYHLSGNVNNSVDFFWSTTGSGTFDNVNTLNAVYTPGYLDAFNGFAELSLTALPASPCAVADVDALILTIQKLSTTNAGGDATIYESQDLQLAAEAENFSSLHWETSGDGTFSNESIKNPVYTPGDSDIDEGEVELCITANPVSPCQLLSSDCMTLTILGALNAKFEAIPQSGVAPLTVQFTDLTTGGPTSWQWDFDFDGTVDSEEQHPEWIYPEPGLYTVSLTVSDGENVDVETKQNYISVTDTQLLELTAGWNDISSYLIPNNPNIETLTDPISGELIILQNLEGFYYPPANVNTLGNWDHESGYFVKLNNPASLSIEGGYVPNPAIQLEDGWNLIPVLNNTSVSITKLFGAHLGKVEIIKNGVGTNIYWLEQGIFSLQELTPGESYFVKVSEGFTISFANVNSFSCGDVFVDERDGQEYETVLIGEQCWMAENLNVGNRIDGGISQADNDTIEKYCYDNNESKCDIYGGLYQWNEVMQYNNAPNGICPSGWEIPSSYDFCKLATYLDPQVNCGIEEFTGLDAGGKMKEAGELHWLSPNTGATNESGFSGLPSGYTTGGSYYGMGYFTVLWTKTTYGPYSLGWRLNNNEARIKWQQNNRSNGSPVRCYKDIVASNLPPTTPSSPIPINGSGNQSLQSKLFWSCYDPEGDPLSFDVYFGADAIPPLVSTDYSESTFDPGTLESDTEYFWKIVADDGQGNTAEGPVWNFTTRFVNLPPVIPSEPTPPNGSENQTIDVDISWTCSDPENDLVTYIVYFGKGSLPGQYTSIQPETFFDPGALDFNATYFWQIIAYDTLGNASVSPVWSFTTEDQ
jgi:uncharacterized protein (TIGR02145 family)